MKQLTLTSGINLNWRLIASQLWRWIYEYSISLPISVQSHSRSRFYHSRCRREHYATLCKFLLLFFLSKSDDKVTPTKQTQEREISDKVNCSPQTKTDTMLNKSQKLGLGIGILLIVDVIWVASSEATKVSDCSVGGENLWLVLLKVLIDFCRKVPFFYLISINLIKPFFIALSSGFS